MGIGIKGSISSAAMDQCKCDGAGDAGVPGRYGFNRVTLCLGDLPAAIVRHEEMPDTAAFSSVSSVISDQPQNISHGRSSSWTKKGFVGHQ